MYLIQRRMMDWTRSLLLSPPMLKLLELTVLLVSRCLRWLGPVCRISHHLIEPLLLYANRVPSSHLSSGSEVADRHAPEPSSVICFRHEPSNLHRSCSLRKSMSKGGSKPASGNPNLPCHLEPAVVAHVQLPRGEGVKIPLIERHMNLQIIFTPILEVSKRLLDNRISCDQLQL